MRLFVFLILSALLFSCAQEREDPARQAVKRLVAAPEEKISQEMARVFSFGRYALPDIEEELHSASPTGRLRLIEALRRLGQSEAAPFLDILARWDPDQRVRLQAKEVCARLRHRAAGQPFNDPK